MLTDFSSAAVDNGMPTQRLLTPEKVENDLGRDGGREVTICALERAQAGLRGDTGTFVAA
ncbi:MAG TPA: hypothetical protein VLD59_07780 [Steroidobacteraceae bacterium]|nr:hypothetical protein [Steroidobacteraceae bacterium]